MAAENSGNDDAVEFCKFVYNPDGNVSIASEGVLCRVMANNGERIMAISEEDLNAIGILVPPKKSCGDTAAGPGKPALTPSFDTSQGSGSSSTLSPDPEPKIGSEWGTPDTKMLLDKYETYLSQVGPLKRFRAKKMMWGQITADINSILGLERTPVQCENRYKTIMKRKVTAVTNNKTSGCTRKLVEFEDEIDKIKAIDDSLEPEVLRGQGPSNVVYKRIPENKQQQNSRPRTPTLHETLVKIQEEKEVAKNKRHAEKMELIERLFGAKNSDKE